MRRAYYRILPPATSARPRPRDIVAAVVGVTALAAARVGAQPTPLPRSAPERQGVSSPALLAFVRAADTVDALHGLVVVRHGHVVAEGWWAPHDAATPHVLFSLSKSFTAAAVGLAAAEGRLSHDDPVLGLFPGDAPAAPSEFLRRMRVRDLLRMTTGQGTEPAFWLEVRPPDSARGVPWARRFLAHPVPFKPGTRFLYNTPATYMLSAAVQRRTGERLADYLGPRLFAPLGITAAPWDTNPDGVTLGGIGLRLRTEDVAKFGLLYLQRGRWRGRQLLPPGWTDSASARQTANGSDPASDWDQGYGYQLWRSRHGYRGDGAFGQYVLVLPEQDAVVAIHGGVGDMQAVLNLVWDRLLPAMRPGVLPDNPAAAAALRSALARLAVRPAAGRPASPLAARVAGRWYAVAPNDRGVRALMLDLAPGAAALRVRTDAGEVRPPLGLGGWGTAGPWWPNGMDGLLSMGARPTVAASGAWEADSVFAVKLVAVGTPFESRVRLRFAGDSVVLDSRFNVNFGGTALPRLVGVRERRR